MSVDIEPSELSFQRPFTAEVERTLTLKNPNQEPVAFKVKTTAPKQYCVRPNSGRIEPGHEVKVTVLLQAMKEEPPNDTKCRDKFLVQSATISPDQEFATIQSVLGSTEKSKLQEKKIRVTWLLSDDHLAVDRPAVTPVKQPHLNGSGDNDSPDVSRTYGSPGEDAGTNALPPYTDAEKGSKEEPVEEITASPVTQAREKAQMTYDEVKAELWKARAEIVSLKQQSQLKLRKAAENVSEKPAKEQLATAAIAVKQGTEGVPVKIVAILCFITFLLAYLFF